VKKSIFIFLGLLFVVLLAGYLSYRHWLAPTRILVVNALPAQQADIVLSNDSRHIVVDCVTAEQLAQLDGYDAIGRARDDGQDTGEFSPIFYKKDRLRLLDNGTFWLSETPDQVSFGWDAACRRVCTWGKFKTRKGGFTFYHFNLHMDHIGVTARREGAKLVVERIRSIAKGAPVVLTGDFNVDQHDEVYRIFSESGILNDSYTHARLRFAENGTFVDFDPDAKTGSRIDHIFVSPGFAVDNYGVLTDGYWTLNLTAAKEFHLQGATTLHVALHADNLLNKRYYNHTSYYRLIDVPEPGRNLSFLLGIEF